MKAVTSRESRMRAHLLLAAVVMFVLFPRTTRAWGGKGHKLIVNQAIDTLPAEIRYFFEANRGFLLQHVTDPLDAIDKIPSERHHHFLYLEKYGRLPFDSLPRSYKTAAAKYTKAKLEANGLLPWQVGVYSEKLTEALKAGHWDEAKLDAAILANYVAEAHDPFNTTANFDGRLTAQAGINEPFGKTLIHNHSSFFPMRPNDPAYISDPTDRAFQHCLSSHSWLETILLADRNARRGENSYNDEYFDRFYNQAAAIFIRQVSDAATDVVSYWLTAWVNAGRPQLPR